MLDAEKNVPASDVLVSNKSPVKYENGVKTGKSNDEDHLNSMSQPETHGNVVLENKTPTVDAGTDDMVSSYLKWTDDEVQNIDEGEVNEVHQTEKMIYEDSQMEANPTTVTTDGDVRSYEFPKVKLEVTDSSIGEDDEGSPEDQAAFLGKLGTFYWEKAMKFKPPRFYGHHLNCLKLWRSMIRLGGYDRVIGYKLWWQVGDSFNPPQVSI
ncbi:AT-rich interactive domain-containing protein 5-like [Solanum stenotomum]|uniref:AT-rich interactive domain-containing protein 5-like n=1 Tax=Solanum stenotomum TaxID=172797 RepID=UPI0020D01B43|nr:AT-rich interactive domain-containing protein 5-like [Solanum stenotomum]